MKVLQVIQNKANLGIFTATRILLKACGWMDVRQLSIILLHKTLTTEAPEYMYKKVTAAGQFSYKTSQTAECPAE